MRFKVIGAETESGKDVEFELSAATSKQAEELARGRGIMISSMTPVKEVELTSIELEPEPEPPAAAAAPAAAPAAPDGDGQAAPSPVEAPHEPDNHVTLHPGAHMEYKLLQNQALYLLEKSINKFLADGWEPTGGLTVAVLNNAPNYFQAIVRRKK